MPATRTGDADHVARLVEHAAAADDLAARLPDHYTVSVIGTGGNVPGILVSDGRPEWDVLVSENVDPDGPPWCASPDQDADHVTYGATPHEALADLDPGADEPADGCAYCGAAVQPIGGLDPADPSPSVYDPCPARGDDGPHRTTDQHRRRVGNTLPDADWQPQRRR